MGKPVRSVQDPLILGNLTEIRITLEFELNINTIRILVAVMLVTFASCIMKMMEITKKLTFANILATI